MRSLRFAAPIIALAALLASAAPSRAQVMQQVPADSMLVIKFNNLEQTNASIVKWAKQMGLKDAPFNDPLGFLLNQGKMQAGLNKAGEAAIAILGDMKADEPPVIAYIPVTDYAAFIGNFEGAKKEGDLDVVKPAFADGEALYAVHRGNYAVLAATKDLLQKKAGGIELAGAAAKLFSNPKMDLTVVLNMKVARALIMEDLKAGAQRAPEEAEAEFKRGGGMQAYAPVIRALVRQAMNLAQETVEDTTALVAGAQINDAGLSMSFLGEFKPESRLGKLVAQVKNTDGALMAGLPEADYMAYGGGTMNREVLTKFVSDFADPVIAELKKVGDDAKSWLDLAENVKTLIRSINGQAFGMVLDPAAANTGMLKIVSVVNGDATTIANSMKDLEAQMAKVGGMMPGPKQTITVTPNAKTVDGVSFDKMQLQIKVNANNPAEAMAAQMMGVIYGPNGPTYYMAKLDDKHYIQVMGDDEELLKKLVAAARKAQNPVGSAEAVKAVAAQLPQSRFAEAYLAVDRMLKSAMTIANAQMGGDMRLDLPPNLPPIGMALSTEGSAIRADIHVPGQLVQSLVAGFMQMQMRMRGGGERPGNL